MKFPQARKNSVFTILSTLFLSVQIAACSTDENFSAGQENTTATNEADTGINENTPALINGVDSGTVTEDIDPDQDNLLEVSGTLTIFDSDATESVFLISTTNGDYGTLTLDNKGTWRYSVDNNLPVIQNLSTGSSLIDHIPVSSADGTIHHIVITILGANEANQPAIIGGIDTGSVTEDDTINSSNLLVASGKLNITDNDIGENALFSQSKNTNFGYINIYASGVWSYAANNNLTAIQNLANGQTLTDIIGVNSIDGTPHSITITINGVDEPNNPAIIGGVDSGSVTEDYDPDNDGQLEISGKLNVFDVDSGQSIFQPAATAGNYGNLYIDTSGNWTYSATNNTSVIQNLGNTDSLVDTFIISSADNTTHTVSITIYGVNETSTSSDITLSWTTPNRREDNTTLSLSEISGYKIYYGTTSGQYDSSITINNNQTNSYIFENFATGTYYFMMTTFDTDDLESRPSIEIQKSN